MKKLSFSLFLVLFLLVGCASLKEFGRTAGEVTGEEVLPYSTAVKTVAEPFTPFASAGAIGLGWLIATLVRMKKKKKKES